MTIEVGRTLFARTSTGAVQVWWQERDGEKYRTVSGQKEGQKVTSEWTTCVAKNVGRANEVSPEEQAKREIAANYTKKLNQGGYKEDEADIDIASYFEPMLAQDFKKKPPKDGAITYSQPKLDGIRCIARRNGLWTRSGKPILAVPHVSAALNSLFAAHPDPDATFDGELYNHLLKDDFNRIVSLVKQQKPTEEDFAASADIIQYHLYDLPSPQPFAQRSKALADLVRRHNGDILQFVRTDLIRDKTHMDSLYETYLNDGYEGQMIRIDGHGYENKRTNNLLKRKEFIDSEFVIDGFEEGVGNRSGCVGRVNLRLPDGRVFGANLKGEREYTRMVWARRAELIEKECTCEYFKPTPDGIPRFGRVKVIHETKRW